MIDLQKKTLLVVAPHPDDEVIGSGGLMKRVKEAGGKVYVIFLTVGTSHDFANGGQVSTSNQRISEIEDVAKMFQIDGWRIAFDGDQYHLQLDQIPQKQIVHEIERGVDISLEEIKPDILVLPAPDDYNQDHRAAALAGLTACRPVPAEEKFIPSLILTAEAPMNSWSTDYMSPRPNFIIELNEEQLNLKLDGMNAYKTQVRGKGHPRHVDALKALANLRGSLIGKTAAEAYYCHKLSATL